LKFIQRILCPLDIESPACTALRYSFALADRFHASIDVVHAWAPRASQPFESMQARLGELLSEQRVHERLEKTIGNVVSGIPGRATVHVVDGAAAAAVLSHSRRYKTDLVVLGSRRNGEAVPEFALGVGEQIAFQAGCAVLSMCEVAEPKTLPRLQRILLPVDFSAATPAALDWAAALAIEFGARLRLLFVRDPSASVLETGFATHLVETRSLPSERFELRLHELHQGLLRRGAHVDDVVLADGSVPDCVLAQAAAQGCDMIILGAHARSGRPGREMQGVIARVRRASPIPVLSVRTPRIEALFTSKTQKPWFAGSELSA
jgi:nucleotide-binding universal stress UspA family protein